LPVLWQLAGLPTLCALNDALGAKLRIELFCTSQVTRSADAQGVSCGGKRTSSRLWCRPLRRSRRRATSRRSTARRHGEENGISWRTLVTCTEGSKPTRGYARKAVSPRGSGGSDSRPSRSGWRRGPRPSASRICRLWVTGRLGHREPFCVQRGEDELHGLWPESVELQKFLVGRPGQPLQRRETRTV
jgi:hypothetical protein